MGPRGASHGSQRAPTDADVPRPTKRVCAGERLPVRLPQTMADLLDFPDTEEVTGSIPVPPTAGSWTFSNSYPIIMGASYCPCLPPLWICLPITG